MESRGYILDMAGRMSSVVALSTLLIPVPATAQTAGLSFEELVRTLKDGRQIVVTDTRGRRTKGRVAGTPGPPLVLLAPKLRTFTEEMVAEIHSSDSVLNGLAIGAATGASLATWDYLIDPSEPGNATIFALAIGLGAGIGAGIDALVQPRLLYRRHRPTSSVSLSPVISRNRQGVSVSLRY